MRMSAVVLLACSCAVWAQGEPTHFRKHHVLYIQAQAGQELTLEVTCIAASIGYMDPLVYLMFGPDGKTAARGTLQPGESKTLTFRPEVDGIYLFDGNPGMNAFSVRVTGGAWAVSISESRVINVIDHANPLYFLVPDGMKSIMLGFGGEAATVRLLRPDGSEAASRKLKNYENATVIADVAGQPGWWRLELDLADLTVKAPTRGLVEDWLLDPGETAAPGAALLTFVSTEEVWIDAFVPESKLAGVEVGTKMTVELDAMRGQPFKAEVFFISRHAEFTPRNISTPEERVNQVYRVKLKPLAPPVDLRTGMTASVFLAQ